VNENLQAYPEGEVTIPRDDNSATRRAYVRIFH